MGKKKVYKAPVADWWEAHRKDWRERKQIHIAWAPSGIPGTRVLMVTSDHFPYPIAMVWWHHARNGTQIHIVNSFVIEKARRCGLRTYLHEMLLEWYPNVRKIVTDDGTPEGLAWLKATGFKQVSADGCWEYRRPRKR